MCSETIVSCVQYDGKASIIAPTTDGNRTAMCQTSEYVSSEFDDVMCMNSRSIYTCKTSGKHSYQTGTDT